VPRRGSREEKRSIRAVVRFPDSTEIRHLDGVPTPGARLRSASGREWFVADALQSGRDTYTVFCVDRRELFEGAESVPARVVVEDLLEDVAKSATRTRQLLDDMAGHLLERVRRSGEDPNGRQTETAFVASFVSGDGRAFEDVIYATSLASAESEALERARGWNMTVTGIQPGPEWLNARSATGSRRRRRRLARLLRRAH
jgi:hypothetical protein